MGWRFRKSFKVIPGVRLNLSRHGLSATLGAAPFSVNVGPRGVYSNVSIPGTGLYNRERLDNPASPVPLPPLLFPKIQIPSSLIPSNLRVEASAVEIRSASTELLNSESMNQFRDLLRQTYEERSSLQAEVSTANLELYTASGRYKRWERGFLFRRVFKTKYAERKEVFEIAQAKFDELSEQLKLTTMAAHFNIDREQAEPYFKMRDEFAVLCQCPKIWDTLSKRRVNRFLTRSAASTEIARDVVSFNLADCDILQWDQKVPHLPNSMHGDLYIYPGFVLYRAAPQAFALLDFREVHVEFRIERFIEREPLPLGAQIVGQAWHKSNKDGSRDRRFSVNYQIPVVHYANIAFKSSSGLNEEFQFSSPALAQRFVNAWNMFKTTLAPLVNPALGTGKPN